MNIGYKMQDVQTCLCMCVVRTHSYAQLMSQCALLWAVFPRWLNGHTCLQTPEGQWSHLKGEVVLTL